MPKTFEYRLYPTKKQEKKLKETLEECRWLYNHLLEMRKTAYEQEGKSLSLYGQVDFASPMRLVSLSPRLAR